LGRPGCAARQPGSTAPGSRSQPACCRLPAAACCCLPAAACSCLLLAARLQAAGFLEGYLTAQAIFDHFYNVKWWLSQQTDDTFKVMRW
jgi:hypothetical protein